MGKHTERVLKCWQLVSATHPPRAFSGLAQKNNPIMKRGFSHQNAQITPWNT